MINPAADEINIFLPLMATVFFAFVVISGVVVYKVFDLGSAIRRNADQEPVSVSQALMLSLGGVIIVMVGAFILSIVFEILKGMFIKFMA